MLTKQEREDRLCEDLVGVLSRISSSLPPPQAYEQCLGCGRFADPEKPCASCARLAARRRTEIRRLTGAVA